MIESVRFKQSVKLPVILLFYVAVIAASYLLGLFLRFDGRIPPRYLATLGFVLPLLLLVKLPVFWQAGLVSGWWKYVSMPDLLAIVKANLVASALFVLVYLAVLQRYVALPRSVLVLDGLFCFLLVSGFRVLVRLGMEMLCQTFKQCSETGGRVVVIGSGAAGQTIAREIRQTPQLNMTVIGFLDGDPQRRGEAFQGLPVLGTPDELEPICRKHRIQQVIVAQPAVGYRELQAIVEACRRVKVDSKILPTVGEIIKGEVSVSHMRDVRLEDLLGRRPVHLDVDEIRRYLKGKRILVTGAAGSIGSEICRQVSSFAPATIVLVDCAETPLFHIERELRERTAGIELIPSLSDIRDEAKMRQVFVRYQPEVIFHAAAYKHVPMLEQHPYEAISNNVLGTGVLARLAHEMGVSRFVMVSTDKAVNPANVMGASKRAAELYVQYLARRSTTGFITVRFGNVLGSNGSVIPVFQEQIERGGPVTVTHPEVTRFFMTIPEASQLVLQAGSMGHKGEIFLLDMGDPVKILDLAEELIRLSGLRPYADIDIVFTGLRPGEKLYEELLLAGEDILGTGHEKIFVAKSRPVEEHLFEQWLREIADPSRIGDSEALVAKLMEVVPEYRCMTRQPPPSAVKHVPDVVPITEPVPTLAPVVRGIAGGISV